MKFSFKALLVFSTIFFIGIEELSVQEAQAGVVVRRRIRSRFKTKVKKQTAALRATSGPIGGGKTFGTKKSINNVYKARLKEYKIALKLWQKEKKLAEKLEMQYAKERAKQQKIEAKARAEYAKKLAKQRERQQIAITEAREEAAAEEKSSSKEAANDTDKKKDKSIFSKLTEKAQGAKTTVTQSKTGFKKDKLKFMSRLFLSLFGRE